jgi:V/A-type H+-transporting ATPase subunit D
MAARLRLTKSELRSQQIKLGQLEKYLPTLQLKKALLQHEVNETINVYEEEVAIFDQKRQKAHTFFDYLDQLGGISLEESLAIEKVHKRMDNIAGVEIPILEKVDFKPLEYSLFNTHPMTDSVVFQLRELKIIQIELELLLEKKSRLEKELREVSIRVNLFEKVLIPRSKENIKKIKVFLSDLQLSSICQAKAAQKKKLAHAH